MGKDSRDIICQLERDGWYFVGATGSHHHFKHPTKQGKDPRRGLASEDGEIDLQAGCIAAEPVTHLAGYIALVHKDVGTSYGVSFRDVPGCISAGDTFDEALANAAEALGGHLARMQADGDPLPPPRSFEELKADREFADDAAGAIVTVVQPKIMAAVA